MVSFQPIVNPLESDVYLSFYLLWLHCIVLSYLMGKVTQIMVLLSSL